MIKIYQKDGQDKYFFDLNSFNFPAGERHVKINGLRHINNNRVNVLYNFDGSESIVELLLTCDALKRLHLKLDTLEIPYVPFTQQDRVMVEGEPLSIKVFTDLINSLNFEEVWITDPHSDVTPALLNNCKVIHQHEVFAKYFEGKKHFYLICPDAGAAKKIGKLAAIVNSMGIVHCEKVRSIKNGEILETIVHAEDLEGRDCYIVDDCSVGGRTFVEIAKKLRKINRGEGKNILMTTHFFTRDLSVFDGLIDEIYSKDGRVK